MPTTETSQEACPMSQKNQNDSTYGRLADELHNYTKSSSSNKSKTTEQNKLKIKKSLIPKLESNPDKFNPDAAASPELSEFDEDDPNRPTFQQRKEVEKIIPTTSSGGTSGQTSARPVRVSNITLKHDDPKYMRVTFEPFEAETSQTQTLKENQKEEIISPQNVNTNVKGIKLNKDVQSKSSVTASPSRKNITDLVKIRPLKAVHDFRLKDQSSLNSSNGAENPNEVVDIINNYKRSFDTDESANNNEEERFYSYKTNNVYREPSLSIFLPVDDGRDSKLCSHRSQSSSHETTLPANFGAPYFRLDGSMMDDVKVSRVNQNYVNINKFVKSAVQEQQNFYKEATDAAKHLKKKLVRTDSTQQNSKPRSKPKRQMF
ncbi:unnamed protein product [Allacma fusca]|uniref:Uncharacterized protein n=1 Tax=Allacma fusca TaxID=39272 RepID=A0A8J2LHX7_9HEXA|nr:unnamed protein product [Allacma fusca]